MPEEIYIGTKIVAAEEMDEATFALQFHPTREGVVIGPDGKGKAGYKLRDEDGGLAWSPKEPFERAHRKLTKAEREMIYPGTEWAKASTPLGKEE